MKILRLIGNVLWFLFAGLEMFLMEVFAGILSIITIIPLLFGIPRVHFVTAKYVIFPFGKKVQTHFFQAPIRNVVNFVFGGFMSGLYALILAVIFCITIVGIPLGKIMFNVAKLSFAPFKADVIKK